MNFSEIDFDKMEDIEDKMKIVDRLAELDNVGGLVTQLKGMDEENRLQIIETYKETLDSSDIVSLAKGMSEENRLRIIETCQEKLGFRGIVSLAEGMSKENQLQIIETCQETLGSYGIVGLAEGMSEENQLKIIETCKETLGSNSIVRLAKGMSEENRLQIIETYQETLGFRGIVSLAKGMSDDNKLKLLNEGMPNDCLGELLADFSELKPEIKEYLEKYLEASGFQDVDLDISFKILQTFGTRIFSTPKNSVLLKREAEEKLGPDTIYSLIKYYAFNGETLEMDEVLENSELFKKYQEFRKTFSTEKQMEVMNVKDAITEFNGHVGLIQECLSEELTEEEMKILKAVMKEKSVEIKSREELKSFPQKRHEQIESLIQSDSQEALTYLLTGMSRTKYEDKERFYINSNQINNIVNDFEEVDPSILIIKAQLEMMELISNLDESKKREVLRIYNDELAGEFSEGGSRVAESRGAFEDIEIDIRKMYGKELAEALTATELPEEKDGVIELRGEDFKLLVHGLNALGFGGKTFEKREVGSSYLCTSLISEKEMGRAPAGRYYGFRNIGKNALVEEGSMDLLSFALGGSNSLEVSAFCGVEFQTSDTLLKHTCVYNEVVLWREYLGDDGQMKDIWPDYIVCFDPITNADREEAKKMNVPIVLIDEASYRRAPQKDSTTVEKEANTDAEHHVEGVKGSMIDILREATSRCSALTQQEVLEKIVAEMERELSQEHSKEGIEH